ncbi:MAG: DUF1549 domain-containing protein [Armatimonadetes bacterium]|nr:DUF1549 domain-containing protein [Armatimonadota bacterium]
MPQTGRKTTSVFSSPVAYGVGAAFLFAACLGAGVAPKAVSPAAPPQFVRDVAPILDKSGCSVAACHGKFGGRGGFAVSLLTLSPWDDFDPIVRGAKGRRINFSEPEKSLLLLKATGATAHGGGERFTVGSPQYKTLHNWIRAGAPFDTDADAKLVKLDVTPANAVIPAVGATLPVKVVATFSDGTTQNVTQAAQYESKDTAVADVNGSGVVTGKRWGGTAIIVRYLGTVQAAFLTLPRADAKPYPAQTANNFVDEYVQTNLKRMNVVPSRLANDREFLRRVTLDVCGRLPTEPEIAAFVSDKAADKRAKRINELLDSPEFVAVRSQRLGDLLRIHPRTLGNNVQGERGAVLFDDWVRDAVASNMPYNRFVREIIMARGSSLQDGAANFYRIEQSPENRMETVGQAFLGLRMACARCHKNPFDRWNTDDYWNFAAFMGKVGIRPGTLSEEQEVFYANYNEVRNASVTGSNKGKVAPPTFLGAKERLVLKKAANGDEPDYVARFADWTVSPQNPYFAKATVNRLWSHYLGRGVIHPVDDMRGTTPPAVPGLLEALAKDFVAHGYDTKHTIRTILNSRTYQTAAEVNATNKLDTQFYSHFYPRPLPGAVLLDALNQATGSKERFGEFPPETKSVELSLPVGSYFLDTFGRSHREFLAELEPRGEPTLIQVLHILNSPYVNDKVRAGDGTVKALTQDKAVSDAQLVNALFVKTFGRPPSAKEKAVSMKVLAGAKTPQEREEAAQDLMWALISAREFYFVS